MKFLFIEKFYIY